MSKRFNRRAMTLVELIFAVFLLNIVILTGISMELGLRRIFRSTDLEIQLLDEASPILALITKDINRGIGWIFNLPYQTSTLAGIYTEYRIRIDSNWPYGMFDPGDKWVAYRWINGAGAAPAYRYHLEYYSDASDLTTRQYLSRRVTGLYITQPGSDGNSYITLQLTKDPFSSPGYLNPQITVQSSAQYRESSFN